MLRLKLDCTPGNSSWSPIGSCTAGAGTVKEDNASFEVKDYAACLSLIFEGSTTDADDTIYLKFEREMRDTLNLPETKEWTCEGSGAISTSIQVAVGAAFALLWHLSLY